MNEDDDDTEEDSVVPSLVDSSSDEEEEDDYAPILFWFGSSHTTGRLCPYSCRGDGGNRRLTNEIKNHTT